MSGKAPPRAPRALLNSFVTPTASSSGNAACSSLTASLASSRLGAAPPTGPRSLLQGANGHYPQPVGRGCGRGKPYANGHIAIPTGPAGVTPPTGPRASLKGKQVESPWNQANSTALPQSNGASNSRLNGEVAPLAQRQQAISFRLRPPPPEPKTEPPPPPPPNSTPPPPPPPLSEPPPPPPSPPPPLPSQTLNESQVVHVYDGDTFSENIHSPSSSRSPSSSPHPPASEPPPLPPPSIIPSSPPHLPPAAAAARLLPTAPRGFSHQPAEPSCRPPPLPSGPSEPPLPPPSCSASPPPPPKPTIILPSWPPSASDCPPGKNYKVLFDHVIDKDRDGQLRMLAEKLRQLGMDQGDDPRVMGKGKGKEVILRYNGEVINGEHPTVLRDPRKARLKKLPSMRSQRMELVPVKYEYDDHSVGPPPPASVLVMNLSVLTAIPHMRHHFSAHGSIKSLELHLDHKGGPMGIVTIRYNSHEEARGCVEKEHGRPLSAAGADFTKGVDGSQQMLVVFDGEGNVSKAVLKEIEGRRLRELDEKRRKGKEEKARVARAEKMRTNDHMGPASHNSWKANQQGGLMRQHQPGGPLQPIPGLPDPPFWHTPSDGSPMPPTHLNGVPSGPKGSSGRMRKAPQGPGRGRQGLSTRPPLPVHFSISTPMHPWARQSSVYTNDRDAPSPSLRSRSPSPVSKKSGRLLHDVHEKSHEEVVEELARNGFEHVTIDGHGSQLGGAVREEDVRHFFEGFKIDKVLRDKSNWYVTFETGDSARRAALVLNSGARTLGHHSVNVTVHPAPASPSAPSKARWNDDELVEQAEKIILKDLRAMLEKDVVDKVLASSIRHMILDEKTKRGPKVALFLDGHTVDHDGTEPRHFGVSDLRGLSFRKQKKRDREEHQTRFESVMQDHEELQEHPGWNEERPDAHVADRPHKRQKKTVPKTVINEDIESEDEAVPPQHLAREDIESEDEETPRVAPSPLSVPGSTPVPVPSPSPASVPIVSLVEPSPVLNNLPVKRAASIAETEERAQKKTKMMRRDGSEKTVAPKKAKKSAKKKPARAAKPPVVEEVVHEVQLDDFDFDIPTVTQVRLTPTPHFDSSASPPSSPVRKLKQLVPPPPPLDPIKAGICEDDEDIYFVKVALARDLFSKEIETTPREPTPSPDSPLAFRVHITGSARTEGYYSISHAEKSAYVAQYASRGMANKSEPEIEQPQQNIESSRSNRANARRRAQGLEEINQVQRALALSKGESAATELLKFNQLQTRKKHLRFARSPIHDWGLYAMEKISRGEMVIEYVGEIIRAQVADKREKAYERQGIGSSYLFRIDEDLVVDATKKGNLGRLINHSCDPNCTAKIITINGEKKIVIYAKQDIELGSEITYDYHFPIEQDKIPCLCGSIKCRGYLN